MYNTHAVIIYVTIPTLYQYINKIILGLVHAVTRIKLILTYYYIENTIQNTRTIFQRNI